VGVTLVVAPWRAAPAVDAARSDVHPSTTQSNGTTG
jgi:hypothetical protein